MTAILIRAPVVRGLATESSAKQALTMLMQMVRDQEMTPEEAMKCVDFQPEPPPVEGQPLQFTISGEDGFLLMLRMVHDKVHSVEKVISCFDFTAAT